MDDLDLRLLLLDDFRDTCVEWVARHCSRFGIELREEIKRLVKGAAHHLVAAVVYLSVCFIHMFHWEFSGAGRDSVTTWLHAGEVE